MYSFSRAAFVIFVVGALAAGIWAYFQLRENKKPAVQAVELFPDQAFVYVESADLFELDRRISSRSMAVDGLRIIDAVDGLCAALHTIDSLAEKSSDLKGQLEQASVHLAFYGQKKIINWLLGFNLGSVALNDAMREELTSVLKAKQVDGQLQFLQPHSNRQLYLSIEDGVVLVSSNKLLIAASKNEGGHKLVTSPPFTEFRKLHPSGQLLTIYIDHDLYQSGSYSDHLDLSLIGRTGFSGVDVVAGTSEIRINGFIKPDTLDEFTFIGRQRPYSTADLITSLPAGCTDFVAFAADSFNQPLLQVKRVHSLLEFWKTSNDSAMYNVQAAFYRNAGGCLARFTMPLSGAELMMVTVRDSVLAREHLSAISDSIFNNGIVCYRLRAKVRLMEPLSDAVCQFAMLHNQSIFFAERQQDLMQLAGLLFSGSVMGDDEQFTRYSSEHISETFNFLAWCSPRNAPGLVGKVLGVDSLRAAKTFKNFRHFSYSLLNTGVLRSRLHLLYSVEKEQKAGSTLWTTVLDTSVEMQPALFRNHNTGENEIMVQDVHNQLYLVSAKGEVLWKKKLDSKIISQVHIVDAFKNNKFQALFNTNDAIHLIDRNGNYLEGFPRKLKGGTQTALSLFDYEGTRDYRIVLPCSDKLIYNFGIDGKEQPTFVKPRTETQVHLPVQYVNIGGNEYLVAVDNEGKIYTFNRRGQARGHLRNKTTAECQAFYADAGANTSSSFIYYADEKNGLLNKIAFTDKKEIVKLGQDMELGISRFDLADNNRFADLILCYGTRVFAFDLAGNQIYNKEFECEPGYIEFFNSAAFSGNALYCPSAKTLLVHDRTKNTVLRYLSDAPGRLADLFRSSENYLVYPSQGRLHCVSLQ